MDELIKYFEETYIITKEDLALPDDERNFFLGQLAIIDEIKEIVEHGYPIKVIKTDYQPICVDVPGDLILIENKFE